MHELSTEVQIQITQRVRTGAQWLDVHKPNWEHFLEPIALNVGDNCNCVLGQLYGTYTDCIGTLMTKEEAVMRGFLCTTNLSLQQIDLYYSYATDDWLEEIKVRTNAHMHQLAA